jgi:hypothetical protein
VIHLYLLLSPTPKIRFLSLCNGLPLKGDVSKTTFVMKRRRQKEGGGGGKGKTKNYLCKEEFKCFGIRVKKRTS